MLLLSFTLEGYEPDVAGVKHSQNYFCNKSGAIVSSLDFWPPQKNTKIVMSVLVQNTTLQQTTAL